MWNCVLVGMAHQPRVRVRFTSSICVRRLGVQAPEPGLPERALHLGTVADGLKGSGRKLRCEGR
jgi:hypothetical protein